jgi:hypothetical protein
MDRQIASPCTQEDTKTHTPMTAADTHTDLLPATHAHSYVHIDSYNHRPLHDLASCGQGKEGAPYRPISRQQMVY